MYAAKHIYGMPYQAINEKLSLRLEHGTAHISEKAVEHMRQRHPDDFEMCMASLETIITKPDFVGQSPLHPDNFVLVKTIDESIILTAISTIQNEYEKYPVESAYVIDRHTFHRRIRKKHFIPIK